MPLLTRLNYLFEQYRNNAISDTERHELMEMISASSHEQAIKELIAEEIERLEQSGEAIDIPLSNERAAEIFTRIIQSGAEAPVIPLVQPKRKWVGRVADIGRAHVRTPDHNTNTV